MSRTISQTQLRALRLRVQHLHLDRGQSPTDIGRLFGDIFCLQAQDSFAANLGVWVRSSGTRLSDVKTALVDDRSVVRTWCMRGTLHLVPSRDLGWLLPLLGPIFIRGSRRRYEGLGLTGEVWDRALPAMIRILGEHGPLSRPDLARKLTEEGVPTEGQRVPHLVRRAALEGLVCHGPEIVGKPTYVLLQDWVPLESELDREAALGELTRKYLDAYGPAQPEDLAVWSGITLAEGRKGFERLRGELVELETGGEQFWMPASRLEWLDELKESDPNVRLLPAFDTCLLGYRDRDWIVPQKYAKAVHPGGGIIRPTLWVDRRAAGIWTRKSTKKGLTISVDPFYPLADEFRTLLTGEVVDLGRFLGVNTTLAVSSTAGE